MMYKCKMLAPVDDPNASLELLTEQFAGIYTESWFHEKAAHHPNKQYNMNVSVFADMWLRKAMKIFLVYEDDVVCGYLLGVMFRPLTHQASVFQVEDWYARNKDDAAVEELFKYLDTALEFMGADELWIAHGENEMYPALEDKWQEKSGTHIDRYVKV